MSIWCSHDAIGYDDWADPDDPDDVQPQGGQVRSYAAGWSNHYPTTDGDVEREAWIDTAHIAPWCVPGHREEVGDLDRKVGPWLRLSVRTAEHDYHNPRQVLHDEVHASVVLDEGAVQALIDGLTAWQMTEKVHPVEVPT